METETSAPGEKPRFLGVREQRVTGVAVFILTGLSVKLAPILKVCFYRIQGAAHYYIIHTQLLDEIRAALMSCFQSTVIYLIRL